jgi:small-conductance mechanosensitive channel
MHQGVVEEITLNYTKITRRTGEVVYIPNRTIYAEIIENISRQRYVVYTYIIPFSKEKSV